MPLRPVVSVYNCEDPSTKKCTAPGVARASDSS